MISEIIYLKMITREKLRQGPEAQFVFGDNMAHRGLAAKLGKCAVNRMPSAS